MGRECLLTMVIAAGLAGAEGRAWGADQVARWRYGRTAALSLSSDDGALGSTLINRACYYGDPRLLANPDNPNLWGQQYRDTTTTDTFVALCSRHGMRMTFYLDTRQIDEPPDHAPSNPSPASPAPNPPWEHNYGFWPGDSQGPGNAGTWDDWAAIAALGHEIASHSVHHPEAGVDALHVDAPRFNGGSYDLPRHGWLPAEPQWWIEYLAAREAGVRRSFAAPVDELTVSKWRIEQQLRMRAGSHPTLAGYHCISFSYPKGDAASSASAAPYYVSSRLVGGGLVDADLGPSDWQRLPCVYWPGNDAGAMIADLNVAMAGGDWLHESGHALGNVFCCYLNEAALEAFVAYAATKRDAGILWIDTVGNVSRYLRERFDAQVNVDRSRLATEGTIVVRLELLTLPSSPLAEVYDYPLTLQIDVPAGWGEVSIEQPGRYETVTSAQQHVLFDMIPGSPPVALRQLTTAPAKADFDQDGDVDQADFGLLQICISGTGEPVTPSCESTILDGDNDVDTTDITLFAGCMSGPGIQADPDCLY